jgi:hypothetical protein
MAGVGASCGVLAFLRLYLPTLARRRTGRAWSMFGNTLAFVFPRRALGHAVALLLAVAVFVATERFGGIDYWFKIGYVYGSDKFRDLLYTVGASNWGRCCANASDGVRRTSC